MHPIISPLSGLRISASMEEQSSPGKWAQPGVQHPPAPPRCLHRASLAPHSARAPHAPSPQLSTPLQISPKATPLWGHWPGGAESHLLGAELLPNLSPGQGEGTSPFPASVPRGSEEAPGVEAAPAASAGTGESTAVAQGGRNSQGSLPTPGRAFPCWGKLRHRHRLCHPAG